MTRQFDQFQRQGLFRFLRFIEAQRESDTGPEVAPIIDENALCDALESGHLGGAALDVYEFEPAVNRRLLSMKNVVLAPHIGSATLETRSAMARIAATDVHRFLKGQKPLHAVT